MWLFHFSMKRWSAAVLNARLRLKPTSSSNTLRARKRLWATPDVVNYLLQTYGTDDVIAMTDNGLAG